MGQHTTTIQLYCIVSTKDAPQIVQLPESSSFKRTTSQEKKLNPYSLFTHTNNLPSQSQTHTTMAEAMFKEGIETKTAEDILSI